MKQLGFQPTRETRLEFRALAGELNDRQTLTKPQYVMRRQAIEEALASNDLSIVPS